MRLGVIDFSEKHANIGTVVWATVDGFTYLQGGKTAQCAASE